MTTDWRLSGAGIWKNHKFIGCRKELTEEMHLNAHLRVLHVADVQRTRVWATTAMHDRKKLTGGRIKSGFSRGLSGNTFYEHRAALTLRDTEKTQMSRLYAACAGIKEAALHLQSLPLSQEWFYSTTKQVQRTAVEVNSRLQSGQCRELQQHPCKCHPPSCWEPLRTLQPPSPFPSTLG